MPVAERIPDDADHVVDAIDSVVKDLKSDDPDEVVCGMHRVGFMMHSLSNLFAQVGRYMPINQALEASE